VRLISRSAIRPTCGKTAAFIRPSPASLLKVARLLSVILPSANGCHLTDIHYLCLPQTAHWCARIGHRPAIWWLFARSIMVSLGSGFAAHKDRGVIMSFRPVTMDGVWWASSTAIVTVGMQSGTLCALLRQRTFQPP